MMLDGEVRNEVVFSPNREYLYSLKSDVNPSNEDTVCFVIHNPLGNANEHNDNNTTRKLKEQACQWGFGRVQIVSLMARLCINKKHAWIYLRYVDDPVGPENRRYMEQAFKDADLIVFAWGNVHYDHYEKARLACDLAPQAKIFGLTQDRHFSDIYFPHGFDYERSWDAPSASDYVPLSNLKDAEPHVHIYKTG